MHKVSSHSIGMDLWMDVEHCTGIGGQQMFNITWLINTERKVSNV